MKSIKHIGDYLTRATFIVAVAGLALLTNTVAAQENGMAHSEQQH